MKKLMKFIVIFSFIGIGFFGFSQTTVNCPASADATICTGISTAQYTNYGGCGSETFQKHLQVGFDQYTPNGTSSIWGYSYRLDYCYVLLKFDLSAIPANATITSANIKLLKLGGVNTYNFTMNCHKVTENWSECGVTLSTHPNFVNYTSTFYNVSDIIFSIDITSLTQEWVNGTTPNYGVWLEKDGAAQDMQVYFAAREKGSDPFPYLEVTYTTQSHDLNIDVNNVSAGDQSLPGTNGIIHLYTGSEYNPDNYIGSDNTNSTGIANFYDLTAGTYYYQVYFNSPSGLGTEFWGDDTVNVNATTPNPCTFTRYWPYIEAVSLENSSNGQAISWGGTVTVGTPIRAKVTIKNPGSQSRNSVYAKAVLDRNKDTASYDFDYSNTSSSNTLSGNSSYIYNVDLGPINTSGDYYFAGFSYATYMNSEITDICNYDNSHVIHVTDIENPPTAPSSEISGQPSAMYPGIEYSITANYYDPDGATNLKYCDLRLDHPSGNDLTMVWVEADKSYYPYAGQDGADYLTLDDVDYTEISNGEGYQLTWKFTIRYWQEASNGIKFGVYAEDDDGLKDEFNYDGSDTSFLLPAVGVTIITHGYNNPQLGMPNPIYEWQIPMAEAILDRVGRGKIMLYNSQTGIFDHYHSTAPYTEPDNGEKILIFHWVDESYWNFHGYSEAAGDALFSALVFGEKNEDFTLDKLHFIGHSRGCVVNSEAVERLLEINKPVEHVTYLDPHDWGGLGIELCDDYDVNEGLEISYPSWHEHNNGVVSWEGIGWIDTYYQESFPDLDGRPVWGSFNNYIGAIGHKEVHDWYLGTIDLKSNDNSWYGGIYPSRQEGFNLSRIGGYTMEQLVIDYPIFGDQQAVLHEFSSSGIMNGNFSRGPMLIENIPYPGWDGHGGEGNGHIDNGHLELDQDNETRTHNRFYIPVNAEYVYFEYKIYTQSTDDMFKVFLGGVTNIFETPLNVTQNFYQSVQLSIPPELKDSVTTITFKIVSGDSIINSEVWVDNVQIILDPSVNSLPLTPTPYAPEGTINTLTPTFEWSPFQDGGDGNTQKGYQLRVWCDTDGDIKVYDTGFRNDTSGSSHVYNPGAYTGVDPVTGDTMISSPLEWGKQYHWHVRYLDSSDDWSEWSAVDPNPHKEFYTQPPCTPPSITQHPLSKTIQSGETAYLIVEASGDQPFSYQWYEGLKGDTSKPINGAIYYDYQTPGLTSTTRYWVRVSNSCQPPADSNAATITVEICTPPTIIDHPQNQQVYSGGSANLFVYAEGDLLLSYQWYQGISGDTSNPINGATSSSYQTPPLTSDTSYWVKVSNSCNPPANSDTANITVFQGIPEIERNALIALYNSTNGENWTNNSGWKDPPLHTDGFSMPGTEQNWYGVTVENHTVTKIGLFINNLVGTIPIEIGNLTNLKDLNLSDNSLSGSIPSEFGNLSNLQILHLEGNRLAGKIPTSVQGLVSLSITDIGYNALYINADEGDFREFLDSKDPDWESTQTTAPTDVSAETLTNDSIEVSWTPITYANDAGGYRVLYSTTQGGPYTLFDMTTDKTTSSMIVAGLTAGTTYYFVVQTRTEPHENNGNTVDSEYSVEVSAEPIPGVSSIKVISPNGGEYWEVGSVQNITWSTNGAVGNVKIEYSTDNGQNWNSIIDSTTNDFLHPWTIPDVSSSDCLVRISEIDGSPSDTSDSVFSIGEVISLTVSSPNGGENWEVGSTHNITWTSTGIVGNVTIEYSTDNGSNWTNIAASTVNDGNHNWTIPDKPSGNCKIRISASDLDVSISDVSDAAFSIVSPSTIVVTSPNGGETWEVASTQEITWNSTGQNDASHVIIEYSTNRGASWKNIVTSTVNDGSYNWTIPDTPSDNCIIRITGLDADLSSSDISNGVFSIVLPPSAKITITSPNGGESCKVGSIHKITWTTIGNVDEVRIECSFNNGTSWMDIVTTTPNTGSFDWTVPNNPSNDCLVRISEPDGDPADVSDNVFSIVESSTITLISPNGGEILEADTSHNITWTSTGTVVDVKIEYSIDSGASWTDIVTTTDNNGGYDWLVPDAPSDNCRIRISESTLDQGPSDLSDADFSIIPPSAPIVEVIFPNGGESLLVGKKYEIMWTTIGTLDFVKIEYSTDNGTSWTNIATSTANSGTYEWEVPANPAENCLIRVSDANGESSDTSDAVFSIEFPTDVIKNCDFNPLNTSTWTITGTSGAWFQRDVIGYGDTIICSGNHSGDNIIKQQITIPNNANSFMWNISTMEYGVMTQDQVNARVSVKFAGSYLINNYDPPYALKEHTIIENIQHLRGQTGWLELIHHPSAAWGVVWSNWVYIDGTMTPDSITVNSPNGGESLTVGKKYEIMWTTVGTLDFVNIEYSTDNGTSWTDIATSTANSGTYEWEVPASPAENCLIRVSDPNGELSDTSDSVFSIKFSTGVIKNCDFNPLNTSTWTITGTSGAWFQRDVIGYGDTIICSGNHSGDNIIKQQITIPDNANSFMWNISTMEYGVMTQDQVNARVSVKFAGSYLINNYDPPYALKEHTIIQNIQHLRGQTGWLELIHHSSSSWGVVWSNWVYIDGTMTPDSITVNSPNGGESWEVGSTQEITWATTGTVNDVMIEYSINSGTSWLEIIDSTSNDGSYEWYVPDNPAQNCLVRVKDIDGEPLDDSDAVFSIVPPSSDSITVISPNGGENLTVGTTQEISWSSIGTIDNVMIEYSTDSGTSWTIIVLYTVNDGSFNWTIPDNPSDNCLIRIRGGDGDDVPMDVSDAVFSIISPTQASITVNTPNGGESLTVDSTYDITWDSTGTVNNVKIEYSTNRGASWTDVVQSTVNNGSYNWTVPDTPSDNCLVRISGIDSDEDPADVSDSVFSIVPASSLVLTAPNGEEILHPGENFLIKWESDKNIENIKLEYSPDNGTTYLPIGDRIPNTGCYQWQVPHHISSNCLVRISNADGMKLSPPGLLYDMKFRVTLPQLSSTGGEIFTLWLGDSETQIQQYNAPGISIIREANGSDYISLNGTVKKIPGSCSMAEQWHRLTVLYNNEAQMVSLWLNKRIIFEDFLLDSEQTFVPAVSLTIDPRNSPAVEIDHFSVRVYDSSDGKDRYNNLFTEDFESFANGKYPVNSGWKCLEPSNRMTNQKAYPGNIFVSRDAVSGMKSLKLQTKGDIEFSVIKQFSIPGHFHFDTSDKPFEIKYKESEVKRQTDTSLKE